MWTKSDKKKSPYLDALNAGFAVVAFDVNIDLRVANKAVTKTQNMSDKNLVPGFLHFFISFKKDFHGLVWSDETLHWLNV